MAEKKYKTRSTTMMVDTNEIPNKEAAQNLVRSTFRPWLDEMDKDGVEYRDLEFYFEEGLDPEKPNVMAVTAVVMVPISEE